MTAREEQTARHEAGHLAACVVLGLQATEARLRDEAPPALGSVTVSELAQDMDPEMGRRVCKMILAAWAEGEGELPEWPIQTHWSKDERIVATITDHLGFTESDYLGLEAETWKLTTRPVFIRAYEAAMCFFKLAPMIDWKRIAVIERLALEDIEAEAIREFEAAEPERRARFGDHRAALERLAA